MNQKITPWHAIDFEPDFRMQIARSWPQSINDDEARAHWGWKPEFLLPEMTKDMFENLAPLYNAKSSN